MTQDPWPGWVRSLRAISQTGLHFSKDPFDTERYQQVREVFEESGYRTRVQKLIGVYDRDRQGLVPPYPFHIYKLFFLCEITGGTATASVETSQIEFFPEQELPELSVARVSTRLIGRCFEHQRRPELPADFD